MKWLKIGGIFLAIALVLSIYYYFLTDQKNQKDIQNIFLNYHRNQCQQDTDDWYSINWELACFRIGANNQTCLLPKKIANSLGATRQQKLSDCLALYPLSQ
jgi:hypothetical protein